MSKRTDDLAKLADRVLTENMPAGLKTQVGRLHEKGISRRTLVRLVKNCGATPLVALACEAEWDRLEALRVAAVAEGRGL
jgi:hypothetical protein